MRVLTMLCVTASVITAQSPLTTTFANNNGGAAGGAVYFELECFDPAGLTISSIDLNFGGAGGEAGSIDIYLKADGSSMPHTSTDWVGPVTSGAIASTAAAGSPTSVTLTPGLQLGTGCRVGVAIVANGLAHAYTTAGTGFQTVYSTAELEFSGGEASNLPFMGTVFSPRLANAAFNYTSGGICPSIAKADPQGDGCVRAFTSFYEQLTPAGMDLSGSRLVTATPNAQGGYDISVSAAQVLPIGSIGTPETLVLADDGQVAPGTLGLSVGSNCWVAFGAGNSNAFAPSVATMLDNPETAIYSWTDLDPTDTESGSVLYEEDAVAGTALITYDGVFGWGTTDPNTVQFFVNTATGVFTISWGVLSTNNPEDWLVGYSVGGTSADPGATDLSELITPEFLSTAAEDTIPLALTAVSRPVQANNAVPFEVTTENIPSTVLSQIGIIGMGRPGAPLDGIGLPGCFLHASLDVIDFVIAPPVSSPSYTWTALTLPPHNVWRRQFEFNVQAVVFGTPANSFLGLGALTSNGLKCVTGKL